MHLSEYNCIIVLRCVVQKLCVAKILNPLVDLSRIYGITRFRLGFFWVYLSFGTRFLWVFGFGFGAGFLSLYGYGLKLRPKYNSKTKRNQVPNPNTKKYLDLELGNLGIKYLTIFLIILYYP